MNQSKLKLFLRCLLCRRLSQDLAKDLAILAQEIHNVAGDGETPTNAPDAVEPASASKEVTSVFFPLHLQNLCRTVLNCTLEVFCCARVLFPILCVLSLVKHAFVYGPFRLNTTVSINAVPLYNLTYRLYMHAQKGCFYNRGFIWLTVTATGS